MTSVGSSGHHVGHGDGRSLLDPYLILTLELCLIDVLESDEFNSLRRVVAPCDLLYCLQFPSRDPVIHLVEVVQPHDGHTMIMQQSSITLLLQGVDSWLVWVVVPQDHLEEGWLSLPQVDTLHELYLLS